ncbi:hypothetical protein [Aquabacterium sp. G14]
MSSKKTGKILGSAVKRPGQLDAQVVKLFGDALHGPPDRESA